MLQKVSYITGNAMPKYSVMYCRKYTFKRNEEDNLSRLDLTCR